MKDKAPTRKLATTPETPVFPQTMHTVRPRGAAAALPKPKKRDNVFSKSVDTREDRSRREMKTTHNAQTFPHAR